MKAPEPETTNGERGSRSRAAVVVGVCAVLVVVGGAAYGVGRSQRATKTVVRTVSAPNGTTTTTAARANDRGFSELDNGHQAETNVFTQALSPSARLQLQHQLMLARQAAMRYPTVASAEAAGWHRAGPFAPGLGAHFFKWGGTGGSGWVKAGPITDAEILSPASMIYDGTRPDSRISGLMYLTAGNFYSEGFAGANDIWHYHTDVCTVYKPGGGIDTPFGADTTVSKAMCDGVHGILVTRTPWMLHVWAVPGYDSPEGVFSHDNAAITCTDGSYHMIPLAHIGTRASVCTDNRE